MTRAEEAIKQADVLIMMFDQSQPLTEKDVDFIKHYSQKLRVMILNKHDLPPKVSLENFQAIVRQYETHDEQATEFVQACAVTGRALIRSNEPSKNWP